MSDIISGSSGCEHTVLVTSTGDVLGFGCNDDGQLGPQGPQTRFSEQLDRKCTFSAQLLAGPSLSSTGLVDTIEQVRCGSYHSVLIADGGTQLIRWGSGGEERLALPEEEAVISLSAGEDWTAAVLQNGALRIWSHQIDSPAFQIIECLTDISACQHVESLSVSKDWGASRCATVQFSSVRPRAVCTGWGHCVVIGDNGLALTFGHNLHGQCGRKPSPLAVPRYLVSEDNSPLAIHSADCGSAHCLALGADGRVYFWGSTADSKLDTDWLISQRPGCVPSAVTCPIAIPLPPEEQGAPKLIACGDNHSFVAFDSAVYGWGFGQHNALGWAKPQTNTTTLQRVQLPFEFSQAPTSIIASLDTSIAIFAER